MRPPVGQRRADGRKTDCGRFYKRSPRTGDSGCGRISGQKKKPRRLVNI